MPKLSVWVIRLSLFYLVTGVVVGAVLLAGKAVTVPAWLWALRPLHVEGLLFGFVVQFVIGVGFWILPRTASRASDLPVLIAVILLNTGVLLVGAAMFWDILAVMGRTLEAGAVAAFVFHAWPRVRAVLHH